MCTYIPMSSSVFVFSKLWSRWVGDGPKENLIKFGYKSESKVENLGIMIYLGDMLEPIV